MIKKHHIEQIHQKNLTFDSTLQQGLIEYLDVEEEETSMIAMNVDDLVQN